MNTTTFYKLILFTLLLAACGPVPNPGDQECTETSCSEDGINEPGGPDDPSDPGRDPAGSYSFPAFSSSWGLRKAAYDKAVNYYRSNQSKFSKLRYVSVIDFRLHSSKKRWFLFDLEKGKVDKYLTAHGTNSDTDNDGRPTSFSNVNNSKQSSLGVYRTLATYTGKHGHSLRLKGLSSTNSNAEARAIVVHPADYVSESTPRAGRSWGCPALDPSVSRSVIDRIKNGSMMLMDY